MALNEWGLQEELSVQWSEHGLSLEGEKFFMCGEEVMTDWEENNKHGRWDLPSVDYLFLDKRGNLWVTELKHLVTSPRDAWSLLCQVSHRALLLRASFTQDSLSEVYKRLPKCRDKAETHIRSLRADHREFFGLPRPIAKFGSDGKVHRMVVALRFGDSFGDIWEEFQQSDLRAVRAAVADYSKKSNKEFERLEDLDEHEWSSKLGPSIRVAKVFLDAAAFHAEEG